MPRRRSLKPRHCGRRMREVTECDERALGIHAFICDRCKFEQQILDDYGDMPRRMPGISFSTRPPPKRGGLGINRDPQLYGIIRRCRRYEARIASGRGGIWIYVGLYRTIHEAVRARDEAIRRRAAG